jgi:hypothetical protein
MKCGVRLDLIGSDWIEFHVKNEAKDIVSIVRVISVYLKFLLLRQFDETFCLFTVL